MLIPALHQKGLDVITLSSGKVYSPWTRRPYLRFSRSGPLHDVQVLNSPVIAPAHDNFFGMPAYLSSPSLDDVPQKLKDRHGQISVFHFHNIEGLTLGFFRALRSTFPSAVILLSAHNYNLVCPQVNLWKDETSSCTDYENGIACTFCVRYRDPDHKKALNAAGWFKNKASFLPSPLLKKSLAQLRLPDGEPIRQFSPLRLFEEPERSGEYRAFRAGNVELVNSCFDGVLAVSERTRQILCDYGVDQAKLFLSYIGSSQVAAARGCNRITSFVKPLNLAYLGYARRDKGFDFLLDALEVLPSRLTRQINLQIAARIYDEQYIRRLRVMRDRFAAITLFDGYARSDLPSLLKGVHLGIVPPIWEDNLPQVAIEFVARGIPILCSDMGGAAELAHHPDFTYRANSKEAFSSKIEAILNEKVKLESFWVNEPRLFTAEDHVASLLSIYEALLAKRSLLEEKARHATCEASC